MEARELHQFVNQDVINRDFNTTNVRIYLFLRGLIDFVLALFALILISPIIILFSVVIVLESKGSAFFYQERVGLNGKKFNIIKLRSMGIDAEKSGAQWATKNDPRVTRIGSFIRKTRIDELPQLINILKGDMSLIGPRPERPIFNDRFSKEIPGFSNRLVIKPGITGWAQVNGGYEITASEKLKLDLQYINNLGIIIDLKIIFKTIRVVLTGDGAR
ncbi:exopolysaccharide biosynthesis polyprenyl glycosylphosphotransferase [Fictibacillus terranigra]